MHPAVLRMMKFVVDTARKKKRWVGICGEMAGNPNYTLFLLGVGLDELSMGSQYIPIVKKLIRGTGHGPERTEAAQEGHRRRGNRAVW